MASDNTTKRGDKGNPLAPDRLSKKDLKALYGVTARKLAVDKEIADLFKRAFDEQWTQARWDSELENTNWYRTNSASMRTYLMAAADPTNADFIEKKKDTYEFVRRAATQEGVALTAAQINDLTEDTMMNGWGEPGQEYELQRAILALTPGGFEGESEVDTTDYAGEIGVSADSLAALAAANGVEFSQGWYNSAAKSVQSGLTDATFWEDKIRQEAASTFPVFQDQIKMGVNVADIASPYIRTMSELWEINPADIKLNDNTLLGALTNYDEKGNPRAMNLGAFRDQLRKDPRWLETDKAQNEIAGIASGVMKMFGLVG